MKILFQILLIVMVSVKASSPIPFIPNFTSVWLVLLIIMLIYGFFKSKFSLNYFLLLFILFAVLGLIIMRPESYFRSWERLIGFTLNISLLSPLVSSKTFDDIKKNLFSYTFIGLKIIMYSSFVAYFLGINLSDKTLRDAYWAFSGITNQSMVLAPISAICFIQGIWRLITQDTNNKNKILLIIQCLCSIWCIMVAGSRGSLFGVLASVVIIFYHFGSLKKTAKYVFIILLAATLLPNNIIDKALYTINLKQENHAISTNNFASTRESKWEARTLEFIENPILGCGFASQRHFTSDDIMSYIVETGGLEPGSSWLSVLAMTGILGFVTLGGLMIKISIELWSKSKTNVNAIFLLALWIFFLFNGMMEGWVFYSGSFIFYLFWLLFGTISACSKCNYEIKIY